MKRRGDSAVVDGAGGDPEDDQRLGKSSELQSATSAFPSATTVGSTDHSGLSSATTLRDDTRKRGVPRAPVPFGSLSEALGYVVFLVLFVVATAVVEESEPAFYFANRVKAALVLQPFAIPVTLRSSTTGAIISSASSADEGSGSVQKSFGSIQDQPDVWAFLQGPFADAIYGPERASGADAQADASETAGLALSNNRVLGGVRLRTLRVTPRSCPSLSQIPEYASLLPYCYASFSPSVEEKGGYGPIRNSGDLTASLGFAFAKAFFADKGSAKSYADLQSCYSDCERSCSQFFGVEQYRYERACAAQCGIHCKCIYEQPVGFDLCPDPNPNGPGSAVPTVQYTYNWSSSAATESLATKGFTGTTYTGSGYVWGLSVNGTLARSALAKLRADRYIDLATRALVVDATIYNAYRQLFNIVQLVVEFPATGGTFIQFSDVVLRPFRYSAGSTGRVVLECLLVAYVALCWKAAVQGFHARGVLKFACESPWNAVTLLFLLLFTAAIGFRLFMIDQEYGTLSGHVAAAIDTASLTAIPNVQSLARLSYAEGVLGSVNAAVVWVKLLQYTQVSKRMCLLLRMLRRAAADLFWFFAYFVVCICGFAQVGYLLFGLSVRQFRSLGAAILTLLQAVAGDLDYEALADTHHTLGPLYYVTFYLLLLLVLLNVFLAILNDAYIQTIAEDEEDEVEAVDVDEGTEDETAGGEEAVEDAEARWSRHARRELEQLRKYPFSKGLLLAFRLLVVDLKHSIYELRTGRSMKLAKVDPFVAMISESVMPRGGGGPVGGSRKWTTSITKQLDKQIEQHTRARASREEHTTDEQMAVLRSTIDKEISERLVVLVESNRQKTQRMQDMEKMLGSIEGLCQKLITDTAYLRDNSDDESEAARGGGVRQSLKSSLMPHRRTGAAGAGGPASGSSMSSPRRTSAILRPQNLAVALRSTEGGNGERRLSRSGGGSRRFAKRGSGVEDVEEIVL
ncbi:hypothetical protein PybrP1_003556 [[Pythium] brassicae (nom. inval.)]|nr:hypothetical protein PybrP1_003556 [[Pythium] brassicae (nom. inval.)]